MLKKFDTIKTGLEKNDVLEAMGSPLSVQRYKGQDHWTYIIYKDGTRMAKEVHFLDGIVTYAGDPVKRDTPEPSSQVSGQPEEKASEQESTTATTEANIPAAVIPEKKSSVQNYQDLEDYVNGYKDIRYAPQFKPVQ